MNFQKGRYLKSKNPQDQSTPLGQKLLMIKKRKKILMFKKFKQKLMMCRGYHYHRGRKKRKIEKLIKSLKLIQRH